MTDTEMQIRNQLGQALITRAEADERIVQLRAMLQAIQTLEAEKAQPKAGQDAPIN